MAGDSKFLLWLLLLNYSSLCFASELDVQCLKTVLQSVIDTRGILKSSWIFANGTEGFICHFAGVQCWHPNESMVFSLRLGSLGLEGQFPQGLENCASVRNLDLSANNFSGPIPSDIARKMPNLVSLDLSYNSFSGEIPVSISNMADLNILNFQHNQLSGQIPEQFSVFSHITQLLVAYNQLSGRIPLALQILPRSYFVGNQGLCGAPLDDCPRESKRRRKRVRLQRINDESCIGAAAGFVVGFVVAFYFPQCFICSQRLHPHVVILPICSDALRVTE